MTESRETRPVVGLMPTMLLAAEGLMMLPEVWCPDHRQQREGKGETKRKRKGRKHAFPRFGTDLCPQRQHAQARVDGDAAPAARAARVLRVVVRADGLAAAGAPPAVAGVAPEVGPLGGVRGAQEHGAGAVPEAGHGGALARRPAAPQQQRAGGRRLQPGLARGDVVLDEDGHAVEGSGDEGFCGSALSLVARNYFKG